MSRSAGWGIPGWCRWRLKVYTGGWLRHPRSVRSWFSGVFRSHWKRRKAGWERWNTRRLSKYANSRDTESGRVPPELATVIWHRAEGILCLITLNVLQVCGPAPLRPATKPRPASPSTSETRHTKHWTQSPDPNCLVCFDLQKKKTWRMLCYKSNNPRSCQQVTASQSQNVAGNKLQSTQKRVTGELTVYNIRCSEMCLQVFQFSVNTWKREPTCRADVRCSASTQSPVKCISVEKCGTPHRYGYAFFLNCCL